MHLGEAKDHHAALDLGAADLYSHVSMPPRLSTQVPKTNESIQLFCYQLLYFAVKI